MRLLASGAGIAALTACSSSHSASHPSSAPTGVSATVYDCKPYPTGAPPAGYDAFFMITNSDPAPHTYSLRVYATPADYKDVTISVPAGETLRSYANIPVPAGAVPACAVTVKATD